MPDTWDGVFILLAVTAITVFADYARRWMPPPRDAENYTPPEYPEPDDYVPSLDDEPTPPPGEDAGA